jgi:hypothetical protein
MRSVVNRNVVLRRMTVVAYLTSDIFVYMRDLMFWRQFCWKFGLVWRYMEAIGKYLGTLRIIIAPSASVSSSVRRMTAFTDLS